MRRLNLPSMQDPGLMRSMNCLNVWPALSSFSMFTTTSSWWLRSLKKFSSNQTSSSWLGETVLAMLLKPSKVSVLPSWKNSRRSPYFPGILLACLQICIIASWFFFGIRQTKKYICFSCVSIPLDLP